MTATARAWSACSGSTRRPTCRTRCTRGDRAYTETNCYTDILDRAAARARRRAAGGDRRHRPDGLRGRPVDVLQAAARATSRRSSASTSTRCSRYRPLPDQIAEQLARGPDDDRRARLLVPAGHRGDELPDRACQDARSIVEAIDRDGERLRYFHNAVAATSSPARTTAASSGSATAGPTTCCRPTPSSSASTRGRGSRARSCAPPRASCSAATSRGGPATNPFDRFGEALGRDLRGCSRATRAVPRLRLRDRPHGRLRLRDLRLARRLAARRGGRGALGRAGPDRRRLQGALVQAGPAPGFRSGAACSPELAAAWDEAQGRARRRGGVPLGGRWLRVDGRAWCRAVRTAAGRSPPRGSDGGGLVVPHGLRRGRSRGPWTLRVRRDRDGRRGRS